MQNHFIIEMLGIKGTNVDVWEIREESGSFVIELFTNVRKQKCPSCKKGTKRVHSYRNQAIQGPIVSNRRVQISLRKRRYLCIECHCTFYERLQMVDHYQRCTSALQTTALTYSAIVSLLQRID
ncbi:transposase family protein [Alkalibacillus silvisoli]|uniref:transposase family protein n=1 Tax=Alkalibacillus silvisoli TaxID=392823 RepID=UPI0031D8376C